MGEPKSNILCGEINDPCLKLHLGLHLALCSQFTCNTL